MELWKEIEGFPGYMVSNLGRVKSLNYSHTGREQILKPSLHKNGYTSVELWKQGIGKRIRTHKIVCLAFLPNPERKATIDHINRNRQDNRLENLRWATGSEQQLNRNHSLGVLGERYISLVENLFRVFIHRQNLYVYKTFETLTEAIAFRDLIISTL